MMANVFDDEIVSLNKALQLFSGKFFCYYVNVLQFKD